MGKTRDNYVEIHEAFKAWWRRSYGISCYDQEIKLIIGKGGRINDNKKKKSENKFNSDKNIYF